MWSVIDYFHGAWEAVKEMYVAAGNCVLCFNGLWKNPGMWQLIIMHSSENRMFISQKL